MRLALVAIFVLGCGSDQVVGGDATVDAPSEGSTVDAASDASGDVQADAAPDASEAADAEVDACVLTPDTPCSPCGATDAGSGCCPKSGQCVAKQSQCTGGLVWPCAASADCPAGDDCCVNLDQLSVTTCPPSATYDSALVSGCGLKNTCANGAICTSNADCVAPKKCFGVEVAGLGRTIGVCH